MLLYLCERDAVKRFIIKQELIALTSIKLHISDSILDCSTPLQQLQACFTKYAWAAVEKKGMIIIFDRCQ